MNIYEKFYDLKNLTVDHFVQSFMTQLLAWFDFQVSPLTCIHTF